jgi:para-nitrobenzyl esterase
MKHLLLLAAALAVPAAAQRARPAATPGVPAATAVVATTKGRVQGLQDAGVSVFRGIRYAKSPTGPLRFMAPQPADPWTGIHDATGFGAPAMQLYTPSGSRESDFTRQMQAIFPTAAEAKIDNEDCLFLNVWTPAPDTKRRPVMVWFHGGGHDYGSGAWPAYDGRNLAAKGDVVVVTVNHRLNAFGYLYLADRFGRDFAESGNAGHLDLVASLQWVRDNIAAFGGDPANVTIMGESGGGAKVSTLLATPAARGLFHRAIIQSGPGVTGQPKEAAARLTDAILREARIDSVADLRAASADTIVAATRAVMARGGGGFGAGPRFGPVVDGVVLPRDPFAPTAPEQSRDVPVMIGWNKDEMTIFTAAMPWFGTLDARALDAMAAAMPGGAALIANYRREEPTYSPTHLASRAMTARFVQGTYLLADRKVQGGGAPVYMYQLAWETPVNGGILRSPHTLDIPFMFANVDRSRVLVGPGAAPKRLEAMMSDAWLSFARTGVPSSPLLPRWQPYTVARRQVMRFDVQPRMVDDPEGGMRRILSQ